MGFPELAHCVYCGVTLDKRISDHGPDCPYRRGETPGLNAWFWERGPNDLRDLVRLQGEHGNWDYDEYMRGMFNGMELMLAIVEGREPAYRDQCKQDVSGPDVMSRPHAQKTESPDYRV